MQLGFVGLGRMGLNMVTRLVRGGHDIVAYDRSPDAVGRAQAAGARGASSLDALVGALAAPRAVWVMVPSGAPTEATVDALGALLSAGDTIVDGGNTNFHDDVRRAEALKAKQIHYVDAGYERRHLGPHRRLLPDGRRRSRRLQAARAAVPDAGAEGRLSARRRSRRRTLREDGPQRHRVRPDAGLRRRVRADARQRVQDRRRRSGRALGSRQRRPIVAPRSSIARALAEDPELCGPRGLTSTIPAKAAGPCTRRSTAPCLCRC